MANPAEVITLVFGGKTFRCSRRTAAHLAWTAERLQKRHPNARIVVIQGSYNTGVEASAGTHDFDACLDVQIVGLGWPEAQRFLRECGWAAWVRSPPTFTWHIHMVSLGYPGKVGIYVPGQVTDYYNHALGLKGQHNSGSDPSWHPADIDSTIFDFQQWERELEDAMPYTEWKQADKTALATDVASALLNTKIDLGDNGGKRDVEQILREIWNKVRR